MRSRAMPMVLAAACGLAVSGANAAESSAVHDVVTPEGVFTVPMQTPADPTPGVPTLRSGGWFYDTTPGIGNTVAMGPSHTYGAVTTNSQRLAAFETDGNGMPVYEVFSESNSPGGVAASKGADVVAYIDRFNADVRLQVFNSTSNQPLWSYTFDPELTLVNANAVAVSRDGNVVAAGARRAGLNRVIFFNAQTGAEIATWEQADGTLAAIDLNDDGTRAMVSLGNQPRVVDATNGQLIWSGVGTGAGNVDYRISGDGNVIAVGGFSLHIYEWDGFDYQQIINFSTPPTEWFGFGTSVSRDGSTVASMSRESATDTLNIRVWDVATRTLLHHEILDPVPGTRQTSPRGADASDDGAILAFATWGDGMGVYPEIQVYDRDLNLIAEIDMPGSGYDVAITADGSRVVGTGKGVHANVFGSGGQIVVETVGVGPTCPPDLNGDGVVDADDFFLFLQLFAAGDMRADFNNDGVIDADDFFSFLNAFAAGC
ncbi:MAG: hypothetical protein EA423_03755 [Phycisphaerales bacterium]|nr:MAG: hypothetical protein EA423_03755 [Phycisphaerales bacterium]